MTASTLTQLPLMAGSVLLGHLGRAGHWTFSRYMQAPLASTGLLALVTVTALAGSNALYFQTAEHPSPFFAPARAEVATLPTPAVDRPDAQPAAMDRVPEPVAAPVPTANTETAVGPQTTGSVTPIVPDEPVGNAQIFAVQKKLLELQLFSGTVDGYYGPKTAEAIRAFELRNGLTPTGSTDPAVLEAIINADSAGRMSQTAPAQPQAARVEQPAPAVAAVAAPPPAAAPVSTSPAPQQDQLVARLPTLSPAEQVFDNVAESAHNTIDSIIADLDGNRGTPTPAANAPVPTANVAVAQTQPAPQPMPQPVVQQVAETAPAPAAQPQAARPPQAATTPRVPPANDTQLVMQIQRGLASLGFFRAPVDGKPGPETARAIREFENFYRYEMTGQVQPDLVDLLVKAGATI